MTKNICLTLLIAATAYGQKSFTPASVYAAPGLQCAVFPTGTDASAGVPVFTDDDGYARFHALRAGQGDAVKQLTLSCKDSAGTPSSYSVDLTSDDTFTPRPVDLSRERGADRPPLKGDPLSYSQIELIQTGYGLRPDPTETAAYARWLAAARLPGRFLEAKRPSAHSHTVTSAQAPYWVGSVLTGAPNYISTYAVFNVPTAIPGGDQTNNTEISIWNGLGGYGTGSGLIQGGVGLSTSPTVASYDSWREYCCGDGDSNGFGGAFVPNPGDQIYSVEWYCDSVGNLNLNGGYGCTYLQDLSTGAILNCTSATGSPCWSVQALPLCSASPQAKNCMTVGLAAEFVIEDQSPQLKVPSTAFTDFAPQVTMSGGAYSSKTGNYSQTISTDPLVTILTDFTSTTTHMHVTLGTSDQTYFNVEPSTSPTLKITSPLNNATIVIPPSGVVTFTATASDTTDGAWPLTRYGTTGPTTITWSSDVDGAFPSGTAGGTSTQFNFTGKPTGLRHVTARVTNSVGLTTTATIAVTIESNRIITRIPILQLP